MPSNRYSAPVWPESPGRLEPEPKLVHAGSMAGNNAAAELGAKQPVPDSDQAPHKPSPKNGDSIAVLRNPKAGERNTRADLRDEVAAEREHVADERERLADERDTAADERERAADVREAAQDQRQREADERERGLDERGRSLGLSGESAEQRILETIERARDLLELSRKRLDRQEARVRREKASQLRQQAEVDRAFTEGGRSQATYTPDPRGPMERSRVLRKQAMSAIELFAASEEDAASIFEQLAISSPDRRDELLVAASQARAAAARAHELLRNFID